MKREQLDYLRGFSPGSWRTRKTNQGFVEVVQKNGKVMLGVELDELICMMPFGPQTEQYVRNANALAAVPKLFDYIDEQQRKIERLVNALTMASDLLQDAIEGNDMPRLSDMDSINATLRKAGEARDD